MQYLGGKSKLGKQIAYVINKIRTPRQPYWEPFCGSCWVTIHVHKVGPRYCSDGCYELIEMWRALQNGWKPPRVVTEEMYARAKAGECDPALTAFIGFGCSFGGKWFDTFIEQDPRPGRNSYAQNAQTELLVKIGNLTGVRFFYANYTGTPPDENMLIYADPPYKDTAGYKGSAFGFDPDLFWGVVKFWISNGHIVVVSEYAAPSGFTCVLEMPTAIELQGAKKNGESRTERLFMHHTQAHLYYQNVPEQLALM